MYHTLIYHFDTLDQGESVLDGSHIAHLCAFLFITFYFMNNVSYIDTLDQGEGVLDGSHIAHLGVVCNIKNIAHLTDIKDIAHLFSLIHSKISHFFDDALGEGCLYL